MLHRFLGPQVIFELFRVIGCYFYRLLLIAVTHYYICSFVYVIVFVLITWSMVRNTCCKGKEYQAVEEDLIQLNNKVDNLDTKLDIILDMLMRNDEKNYV